MRRYTVLLVTLGVLAASAPIALASGPGGGTGGGSGSSGGGGGGGGTTVNAGSCSAITLFSNTAHSNAPTTNTAAATTIVTELNGTSSCAGGGPYTVTVSYKNDTNNAIVQTNVSSWKIPGNLSLADSTFAPAGTPYTVSYTVTDGSGHVFLSGSQNVLTPVS